MATTHIRSTDASLRAAIRFALFFASIKLVVHIAATLWQTHLGYGYFRDEMYYIQCGRHLAWGYVDHGPVVAVQARLALASFGKSLLGIRMLSALAGAARVFLTGMLCWALGGRRPAQGLATICVMVAPIYLGVDSFLSMNSWESLFWMTAVLALVLQVRAPALGGRPRLWLLWGLASGIGLLNKPSMTFFLGALLVGLLLTPQRRLLFNRWAVAGVALMLAIVSPHLLWQVHHHWPTLEFLRNGQLEHKNKSLAPLALILQQIVVLQPATALVWVAGLVSLLRTPQGRQWRWIGLSYLVFLGIMTALHAKDYYIAPVYPVLFAAGGIAWERRFASLRAVERNRAYAFPVLETILIVAAAILLPLSLPVLRPRALVDYTAALHLSKVGDSENMATSQLPQFYADRFGWQEEVDLLTRTYNGLSAHDRSVACIWGSNYGEAAAAEFLGKGLPPVIAGHNNYFLWGPRGCTGEVVLSVTPTKAVDLQKEYQQVELVGHLDNPWAMPYEHRNIYILRHRKNPILPDWPRAKEYI